MAASYPTPATLLKFLSGPTWSLTRNLRSTNKNEINGQLLGTATFTNLVASDEEQDWLYTESGQFPTSSALPPALAGMASATWSKKYIWRLNNAPSELSAWFVKVGSSSNEADYLFHKFDFQSDANISINSAEQYAAPVPILPEGIPSDQTRVLQARGDHLCINDMYRTSYAFRFHRDTNELLSWSSLHVVRGPAKSQEITNHYIPQ